MNTKCHITIKLAGFAYLVCQGLWLPFLAGWSALAEFLLSNKLSLHTRWVPLSSQNSVKVVDRVLQNLCHLKQGRSQVVE